MTSRRYIDTERIVSTAGGMATVDFLAAGGEQSLVGSVVCDFPGAFTASVNGLVWSSWSGSQPSGPIQIGPSEVLEVAATSLPTSTAVQFTFIGTEYLPDTEAPLLWPTSQTQSTVGSPVVLSGTAVATPGVDGTLIPNPAADVSARLWVLSMFITSGAAGPGAIIAYVYDAVTLTKIFPIVANQPTAAQLTGASMSLPLGGLSLPPGHGLKLQVVQANTTGVAIALYST